KNAYLKLIHGGRQKYEDSTSKLLITEMHQLSESHGAKFLILRLTAGSPATEQFMKDSKIEVIDCLVDLVSPPTKVGGVGHPSAIVHAQWANCLDGWFSRHM